VIIFHTSHTFPARVCGSQVIMTYQPPAPPASMSSRSRDPLVAQESLVEEEPKTVWANRVALEL